MLIFWGRKTSSNVQALMWCIAELGLDYVRHDVGHKFGGNDTPEFLAMNPNGTIPVIQDERNEPIWETGAILRYLASRYGDTPFWPQDISARAQIDKWAEWSKINIALNFMVPVFRPMVRTVPQKRDLAAISKAIIALGHYLSIAEQQLLHGEFLCGQDFTLADIQFGHVLYRYYDLPIMRPEHPAINRYYDRLIKRPAYQEHVMVSYEELRAV
jgi:glutathione S-transferase